MAEMAVSGIGLDLPPSTSGFWTRWVYVDVGVLSPFLLPPSAPAVPSSGWGHEKLASPRLAFVWLRLKRLKDLGLTAPMVVKEFLRRRVAPLQRHSQPMWAMSVGQDHMRLHVPVLPSEAPRIVLELLTGNLTLANLLEEGCLLYCCSNKVEFARQMPPFDEWGLRPADLEGPRENPVSVAPLPATGAATSLEVGAGGRPLSAAGDAAAKGSAPLGAPGGPTHGPL